MSGKLIVLVTSLLAAQLSWASEPAYQWRRALAPGKGVWPDAPEGASQPKGPDGPGAAGEGGWPMASVPVVAFGGHLWMPQDARRVWHSADGVTWKSVPSDGGWGSRYGAVPAFFHGKLWLLGGADQDRRHYNDVWSSSDGRRWSPAAQRNPWSARRGHAVAVYEDSLWLLGGGDSERSFNDVWRSSDGTSWTPVTEHAPWPARAGHSVLVHAGKLWVIGGGGWESARADVWSSSDGRNWAQATTEAAWPLRVFPGAAAFDGRMWVFGGSSPKQALTPHDTWLHDVWSSADGVDWKLETAHAPWTPRAAEHCVVFAGKLWLFGGKGIEEDGRGGYASDVWCLTAAAAADSK